MQLRAKHFAAVEQSFRHGPGQPSGERMGLAWFGKSPFDAGQQADAQRTQRDLATSWALADSQVRAVQ
jgi:hypothetical protein